MNVTNALARAASIAMAIAAGSAMADAQSPKVTARPVQTALKQRAELSVRTTPSIVIHVIRLGRGSTEPPLVLLSGWTVGADIWEETATALANDRQVFLIDSRSQGRSSVSFSNNTPEDRAADLASILDKLHIVRPIVIGWSQGAQDLAAYVSLHGDSALTGSVMVDATPSAGVATLSESPEFARQILQNMTVYQAHPREFSRGLMDAIIGNPAAAKLRSRLTDEALATPVSVGVAMQLSDLLGIDRRGARFTRPLLIVVAADGPLVGDMRQYAERVGARFELIRNARHAVFVDARDDFVALVRRFESTSSR